MRLTAFLREGIAALAPLYPETEARSLLLMLCEEVLGTRSYTHLIEPQYEIDSSRQPVLEEALRRLSSGEPIQYVLGKADFCGRTFRVNPSVLIPRPETEILCERAVALLQGQASPRVLDLCTGSGNIAWTVALSVKGSSVVAVDKSEAALSTAAGQPFEDYLAEGGCSRPHFVARDMLLPPPADWGLFDMILSNPPYVMESERGEMRPNVLCYEPSSALFVPDEDPLLFYRAAGAWARRLLRPGGHLLVEINERTGLEVQRLMSVYGLSNALIIKDFYEKDRFVLCEK